MRLFTAVTLDEEIKDYLSKIIEELTYYSTSGNFTRRENLHLTLNFIGETDRPDAAMKAMKEAILKANVPPFQLLLGGLGRFKRREGDLYWVGVAKESSLWYLQQEVAKSLREAGFPIEDREFKPHLTLGRKVTVGKNFQIMSIEKSILPKTMEVSRIHLMKSERIQGKLTYTEIYHLDL